MEEAEEEVVDDVVAEAEEEAVEEAVEEAEDEAGVEEGRDDTFPICQSNVSKCHMLDDKAPSRLPNRFESF